MAFLSSPQLRQFLAGIAIFLYALDTIETIAKSWWAAFQKWIESMTNTKLKSFFLGVGLVNILQSSHAVSLIILALVGSGYIMLSNAIAVVIGMNVGSVFMEALIGLFGLGFDMDVFIMPMIGIWWLGAIFSKKYSKWFSVILCLGLVFLGLEYMKDSIKVLRTVIDLQAYASYHRLRFVPIGIIATILTQSSSAVTIIAMTALNEWIITLPMSASLLMGAYIGSSTTALFVSFKWWGIKKQVALSHFLFNAVTCTVFAFIFPYVIQLITGVWWFGSDEAWFGWLTRSYVNGLIIFFILFKAVGAIIHLPFINTLTKWLQKVVPTPPATVLGIENIETSTPIATQLGILKHDLKQFWDTNKGHIQSRFHNPKLYDEAIYYKQKWLYDKMFRFMVTFPFQDIGSNADQGSQLMNGLQETMQAFKLCKDCMRSINIILDAHEAQSTQYMKELDNQIQQYFSHLENNNHEQIVQHIQGMRWRDEFQMQQIISAGQAVSSSVAELIQIHDYIHGSLNALHEWAKGLGI